MTHSIMINRPYPSRKRHSVWCMVVFCITASQAGRCHAQGPASLSGNQLRSDLVQKDAGDTITNPGPFATDLSPVIRQPEIRRAMRKVADGQMATSEKKFDHDWTYAPLYLGLLATSATTGDPRHRDSVLHASEQFQWRLWDYRPFQADDEAIGQTYEILYSDHPDPLRIADVRATFDRLLERHDDPTQDLWWWCDVLFMGPLALAKMSALAGDHRYIDKMNAEWRLTTDHLYDPSEHLCSRDASYLRKTEKNGKKIFWSRGNGWVLAGTVNVLRALPRSDLSRQTYLRIFRDMSERIAGLQQPDGLWKAGLLDQRSYNSSEVSGSAFFTYALTWGINEKLLDRATFGPVVERAWKGMLQHIYADGRLGSIQPIGAASDGFQPSSSYVYGVGAFLMAGAEVDRYAAQGLPPNHDELH